MNTNRRPAAAAIGDRLRMKPELKPLTDTTLTVADVRWVQDNLWPHWEYHLRDERTGELRPWWLITLDSYEAAQ